VAPDIKLADLHKVIQTVMGWENCHQHQFIIDGQYYTVPDNEGMIDTVDYRRVKLNELMSQEKQEILYEYDFGDGWVHMLTLEKISLREPGGIYPHCVDGKRHCPPEDCGGPPGYDDLLAVIKNPDHPEHDDMMAWLDGGFDPEKFNISVVNKRLQTKNYGCG
jgi:hypothetical protein